MPNDNPEGQWLPSLPAPAVLHIPDEGWSGARGKSYPLKPISVTSGESYYYSLDGSLDMNRRSEDIDLSPCHYLQLPAEIHFMIIDHLQYPDQRNLKNTASLFRAYITDESISKAVSEWKKVLHYRDLEGKFTSQTGFLCYGCVRVRNAHKFEVRSTEALNDPVGLDLKSTRRCLDCTWSDPTPGTPVWIEGAMWTSCVKCKRQSRAYYWHRAEKYRCTRCGRFGRIRSHWLGYLYLLAEFGLPWTALAFAVMAKRQGVLLRNKDSDGKVGQNPSLIFLSIQIALYHPVLAMFVYGRIRNDKIWTDFGAHVGNLVYIVTWLYGVWWCFDLNKSTWVTRKLYQFLVASVIVGIFGVAFRVGRYQEGEKKK